MIKINMQKLTINEYKIITQKWSVQILFILYSNKKISYKKIKNILQIPNSTLSLRVNELTKYNYLKKFVYGSVRKPHYTEYQITEFGLDYLNNIIKS